jgi:PIF1-like helicase/Helix-turn-helix domain/HRDC domain
MNFQTNPQLDIAFEYVRYTDKNIFLTGRAGTGKTTFLHQIKNEATKRMVIVAPTGVAAINAGGVTIHSFFQLPFGPFLPGNAQDLARQRRFSGEKIKIIKSLDLLVIDEISMVRADLLDGIDDVLRRYRDYSKPFGGVQLLMIGDLHQLPPVVKDEEWGLLREHYNTAYFFGSNALQKTNPVAIELKHIYRQSDDTFIRLLNKVRDNKIDAEALALLNSRYDANFSPKDEEAYITLTSHNASAQSINVEKLAQISGTALTFKAKIDGDFPAFSYPTEEILEFKAGAQVMFVKNDISRDKLYYNGKIGTITRIEKGIIFVKCPNEYIEIEVSMVEWQNIKYALDEATKEVKEEVIGTFTQYPLKLAWAITIHKSQGLTFERAIIDANAAFAHGQVYVALSRCKTFEGIVLRSKIANSSVKTDHVVKNYSEDIDRNAPNEAQLKVSKIQFQQTLVSELFDFASIKRAFERSNRVLLENENIINAEAVRTLQDLWTVAENTVFAIANKFKPQIQAYFAQTDLPEENENLQARIQKAAVYFEQKLKEELLSVAKNITVVTDNKAVQKTISDTLETLQKEIFIKNACFEASKEAFSTVAYLRAKANADMDFLTAKKMPSTSGLSTSGVPKDAEHPKLYAALKAWRDDMAAAMETEHYMILPASALLDLSNQLPTTTSELKSVKGIGVVKVKQYGEFIVEIIKGYCEENNIEKDENTLLASKKTNEKAPKTSKTDTKVVSFELYKSGKTIAEIATERGFAASTIEGHLAHFFGQEGIDVYTFVSKEKVEIISEYLNTHQVAGSGEVFTHFGGQYSYGEIKMVWKHVELERGDGV